MSLKEQNLRFALLKAVAEAIAEEMAAQKVEHTTELVARYDDEGTKSFDVKLPSGEKVAAVTLAIPKAKTEVTDEEAFLDWCLANMPTAVTEHVIPAEPERVIPATPARTVYKVDPKMAATLLADAKPIGDMVADKAGVVIDGVTHTPAAKPKQFSVLYEGKDAGREALILAWRAGELGHVVDSATLPALEPSNVITLGAGDIVAAEHGWVDDLAVPFVLDEKAETIVFEAPAPDRVPCPQCHGKGTKMSGGSRGMLQSCGVCRGFKTVDAEWLEQSSYAWPQVGGFSD